MSRALTEDCESVVNLAMHVLHTAKCSCCGPLLLWQTALSIYAFQACQSATAQTSSTDVQALTAINNLLLPPSTSDAALHTNNWTLPDPCGPRDCGVAACTLYGPYVAPSQCNWDGICCLNWKVVGMSLLSRKSPINAALSTVLDAIGSLDNLAVLRLAHQG